MKNIVYLVFALLLAVAGPVCGQSQYTLGNIPEGWTVTADEQSVTVTNGTATITEGATVVLTPPNPAFVKSVTLTDAPAPAPSCRRVDLSQITADSVIQDCDTLTGTLAANVKISIANGATVILDGVSINADGNWTSGNYAGITCEGDATIILKDDTTNTVKGFNENYSGIYVPESSTLTIQGETSGTGKLIASSNGYGAGIGGGSNISCGNINIQGGDIKATGGKWAAGIGSGFNASCDTITISGGTVNATGGKSAAGIGSGYNASCDTITISGGNVTATGGKYAAGIGSGEGSSCGNITITSGVTSVTATKGTDALNSIGAGPNGSCGTVTFDTQQMYNGSNWTTTPTSGQTYGGLNFTIKTTTSNNDTWELTPPSN